jgi:rhamnulokinase
MPKNEHCYIACDLGADSGRVILGKLESGWLTLDEVHRFSNGPAKIAGSLRWDILRIFEELKIGLRKFSEKKIPADSLSVDSWGVDYVLFNKRQPMLSLPYHYRDARTDIPYEAALKGAAKELIFSETGIQFMPLNTLYQLIADVEQDSNLLAVADQFLNIGDYLNFLFSGVARAEESLASTTQIYNPATRSWSARLMDTFNLPAKIFPQIVPSGARLGPLSAEVAAETGLSGIEVVAGCSHDTGAAVAAVPAEGEDWAYLSSGTWSLIGVELQAPLINDQVREHNFTNEAGYGGTTRFLKNIIGLWILQESKRAWARQGHHLDYAEIERLAGEAEPFRSLINPNAPRFLKPDAMPEKIAAYCRETGQPIPETPGQYARCIYESLALRYRSTLDNMEQLIGRPISRLHIVGGGSKDSLLNQLAANATGRTVLAGPVEATACGNVLIQALTLGHLPNLAALRQVVRASFPIRKFDPVRSPEWQQAAGRFAALPLAS